MPTQSEDQPFHEHVQLGWDAALLEIEHQAEHWATPDRGQIGHFIAETLRATVSIARDGGLQCEHRSSEAAANAAVQLIARMRTLSLLESAGRDQPSSSAKSS